MIFYFSGTGNSAWVARQIAGQRIFLAQFENLGELVKNTIFVA